MSSRKSNRPARFSESRRRFIAGALRSGMTLAAATSLSRTALAGGESSTPVDAVHDYIVVGAGAAGCVVADRLSAAGFSVLLLEAGTGDITQPKIADANLFLENLDSDTDWAIPMPNQPGLGGRALEANAGRVLGGGSSINSMFWLRPDERDLAGFHRSMGPKWSVENFYAATRRVERFVTGNSPGRSLDGEITVGRYSPANPLSGASLQGAAEISIPTVDQNSSRRINGAGFADVNIQPDGIRSGAAETYIAEAITRKNFDLITDSLVTNLVVRKETCACTGVDCVVEGDTQRFLASREVILSAGSLGSPKILLLSGIGRESDLKALGIDVAHNLPSVGYQLQDHLFLDGVAYRGGPAFVQQQTLGKVATQVFCSTDVPSAPPNIQLSVMQSPFPPSDVPDGHGFNILPWIVKPKSRGRITLQSTDPRVKVLADPAYFSEPADLDLMIKSLDIALALGATASLQPFVDTPIFAPLTSRDAKVAFIQAHAFSGLHFVSTCAAGVDPATSVVTPRLKVWGVENLRVVDASVFPEVPGVNPHFLILSMAEIASQIILQTI